MKFACVDCETTGLSPRKHGIWQLAGAICNERLEPLEEFNLQMYPLGVEIDDRALAAGNISLEALKNLGSDKAQYEAFVKMLDKHVDKFDKQDKLLFVGYNARFDMDFVRAMFERFGNKYFGSYFWFPPLDVMGLAAIALCKERHLLGDFKLETVVRHTGLLEEGKVEKFHDAAVDIRLTLDLFKECLKRIRSGPRKEDSAVQNLNTD